MPDKYKYKLGKTQYKWNIEQQKKGFETSLIAIEKVRKNREIIYQQLLSIKEVSRQEIRIFKSWLREYPNFTVAREVADQLSKFQDTLDENITELLTKCFLESDLTNATLTAINEAIQALYENEEIVNYNLEIPPHLNEQFVEHIVTSVLSSLYSSSDYELKHQLLDQSDNENKQDQE